MKKLILISSLIIPVCFVLQAQVATQIDAKSITLPRYNNLSAITRSLPAPQQGMMVYNNDTATNWFYNGSTWINLALATSVTTEPEGFGNWGCNNSAFEAYQPVGNPVGAIRDNFGSSVAISGDYAIVGARLDDEGGFTDNGSATVFKRNSTSGIWESQGKLVNPAAATNDYFGNSVAISGDYAIVGANYDDEGGFTNNGSATVFKRNITTGVWESQGKLVNSAATNSDLFGSSVAISGDYAIVGAPYDDENGFTDNGSATVFKRNTASGIWEFQGKLINPATANSDLFGNSVAISGDYAIVGAQLDDDEIGYTDSGSATVFKRNTTSVVWESQGKLINPAVTSDNFGSSVAISGDYVIVGAYLDDEIGYTDNGSATVFKRNSTSDIWESQGKLVNSPSENYDGFGRVTISGDYAIVGAYLDDENGFTDSGSFTVYRRYGEVWGAVHKSTHPGTNSYDYLSGCAIEGSTRRFLVGTTGVSTSKGLAIFGKVK